MRSLIVRYPLPPALMLLTFALLVEPADAQARERAVRLRVDSLLSRMTLEEKVGQMTQLTIGAVAAGQQRPGSGEIALDPAKVRDAIVKRHIGSLINVLDAALPVTGWHTLLRQIQDVAVKESRLHIPVLYGVDFVHGANYTRGGTIFPHNIGMAATFDVALARRAGEITSAEAHASGLPWNFAPVLDVGRQPLWPRFYETYGEDPVVAARLGSAFVAGSQASGHTAATLKHYLGYGVPRSGRDRTPAVLTEREVREYILPPFRAAVQAGARSVMVNSGEIDGEPLHASHHWLSDVLRGELGFQGVIVTDWEDVTFLNTRHHVAPTMKDAVRMAISAGIDVCMTPNDFKFTDELLALVHEGAVSTQRIDESVRRILTLKAVVGLLDSPYPDASPSLAVPAPDARATAQKAARESITLLENDGTLPLRKGARILVTGPGAQSLSALNGGWTYTWQGSDESILPKGVPTLLDAIRAHGGDANVRSVGGKYGDSIDVAAAVRAAKEVDVAVVVLGEVGYAEWVGDLDDLTMPASQLHLASAIAASGTPTVVVLLEGRPRIIRELVGSAKAIVMAYWPGMEGANAIADVLFGDVNPSGRLPFTYPKYPNALLTYDHKVTETLGKGFGREPGGFDPQWEFGHGRSYTTFNYGKLTLGAQSLAPGQRLTVQVSVTNSGTRQGEHSVLLFTRQRYASLTPSVRRLRGFERVTLAPGESRVVQFTITTDDLTYVGRDGKPVLEAGTFDVMIGGSTAAFQVVKR